MLRIIGRREDHRSLAHDRWTGIGGCSGRRDLENADSPRFADFPRNWLPLVYLYDLDLPLYPLLNFHALDPAIEDHRSGERDRVFGFVHHINLEGPNLRVSVALNKDLNAPLNKHYEEVVRQQCRVRMGLSARVDFAQLARPE